MSETKVARRSLRQAAERLAHWMAIGVFAVAGVAMAVAAHAQEPHRGPGMGGPDGPGMMSFGGPGDHMGRGLDRMLDGLGVSDAQRAQIHQIAMAAADVRSQREARRALHERGVQIFTAPTVDAAAAEALRQQMLALRDQASKRELQAMLDIAKVLTPEQRAKIGERMKERGEIRKDRMQRMQRMHQEHAHDMAPPPPTQK